MKRILASRELLLLVAIAVLLALIASRFPAFVDQDEGWRVVNRVEVREVVRPGRVQVDTPQRRPLTLRRLGIDGSDLAIPGRAPGTAGFFEHDQLGGRTRSRKSQCRQPDHHPQEKAVHHFVALPMILHIS